MPAPGSVLGHYRIEEKLGEGAFGSVFRGEDVRLHRKVAVKVLHPRGADDAEAWGRLLEEARAASALHHPNICSIYDVGEDEGLNFIALEYVEGRPLADLIREGPLPLTSALSYATQVAGALAHAHRRRIIHRDLKASNIMITPEGHATLLDFGLARRLETQVIESLTQSRQSLADLGSLAGTLCYMAPEVLRGKPAGVRSDLWSLGALLYETLAGHRPFAGENPFELSVAIMVDNPEPLPPEVPALVRQAVSRCLQKEPRKRFASAEELLTALNSARAKIDGKRRWLSWRSRSIIALSALVLAAGVIYSWRRRADLAGAARVKAISVQTPAVPAAAQPALEALSPPPVKRPQAHKLPGDPNAQVWVNTKSRVYHCTEPASYTSAGHWKVMKQVEAEKSGYRASRSQPCP